MDINRLKTIIEDAVDSLEKADIELEKKTPAEKEKFLTSPEFKAITEGVEVLILTIESQRKGSFRKEILSILAQYRRGNIDLHLAAMQIAGVPLPLPPRPPSMFETREEDSPDNIPDGTKFYIIEIEQKIRLDDSDQISILSTMAMGESPQAILEQSKRDIHRVPGADRISLRLVDYKEISQEDFFELKNLEENLSFKRIVKESLEPEEDLPN